MSEYIVQAAEWAIDKNGNSLYQGCEEIVRCRDCTFSRIHDGKRYPGKKAKGCMYCINWGEMLNDWTKPDGFCHRAKRKENGE